MWSVPDGDPYCLPVVFASRPKDTSGQSSNGLAEPHGTASVSDCRARKPDVVARDVPLGLSLLATPRLSVSLSGFVVDGECTDVHREKGELPCSPGRPTQTGIVFLLILAPACEQSFFFSRPVSVCSFSRHR